MKKQNREIDKSKAGVRIIYELCRCPHITPEVFRVFAILASHNPCYPNYERILQNAGGMSRKTLSNAIQELCARKMIAYERGYARGRSNVYTVLPEQGWDLITPSEELVSALNRPARRTSTNRDLKKFSRSTDTSSKTELEPVQIENTKQTKGKLPKVKQTKETEEDDSSSSSHFISEGGAVLSKVGGSASNSLSSEDLLRANSMAAALDKAHQLRCNGILLIIQQGDPEWPHVVAASKQAYIANVSPNDWIAAIVVALLRFGKSSNPFPNASQLHGAKAAKHVGNYVAETGPSAKGVRRARLAVGVPLGEDHEYQRIRNRIKKNIHTSEDVAYMRTRQIEFYGMEKPWLKDVEAKVNAREVPPKVREQMNSMHPAGAL